MKPYFIGVALFASLMVSTPTTAEPPDIEELSCPLSKSQPYSEFRRSHEVPTVSTGKWQPETVEDILTIVGREENLLCFHLVTYAMNYHTCGVMGVAAGDGHNTYLLSDGPYVIRLLMLDNDHVRVEPVGEGYRENCGTSGVIEPAVYVRIDGT